MKGIAFYGQDFFIIKTDNELIKENISRILLTLPSERVMSSFGSLFKSFLFDQSNVLQEDVDNELKKSISRWEPRVVVNSASASIIDVNRASITLSLTNKTTLEPFTYNAILNY